MIHRSLGTETKAAVLLAALSLATAVPAGSGQPLGYEDTAKLAALADDPRLSAEDNFAFELGRAVVDRGSGASSTYIVTATQDYRSKTTGGKVRLSVLEKEAGGTMTHLLTINAGKFKTVAQLTGTLADIFREDLAVPAADQEIGKIGDLGHGGEIRFFAESNEALRYDWAAPGEPVHSTRFKRADIQVFLGILTHPKAGA